MKCDNCRTELPNSKGETLKCPECGEEYEDSEEQESSPQTDNEHTFYPMMCHKCGTPQEQQSKEDWWHCSCGSYHKGFPYKCPIKQAHEEMQKEEEKIFRIINEKLSHCAFFEHLNYKQQEELELTINDIKKLWKQNRLGEGEKK